jgi:hypothetical protein
MGWAGARLGRSHDGLSTFYLAGALEAEVQSGLVLATRTIYWISQVPAQ